MARTVVWNHFRIFFLFFYYFYFENVNPFEHPPMRYLQSERKTAISCFGRSLSAVLSHSRRALNLDKNYLMIYVKDTERGENIRISHKFQQLRTTKSNSYVQCAHQLFTLKWHEAIDVQNGIKILQWNLLPPEKQQSAEWPQMRIAKIISEFKIKTKSTLFFSFLLLFFFFFFVHSVRRSVKDLSFLHCRQNGKTTPKQHTNTHTHTSLYVSHDMRFRAGICDNVATTT